MLNRNFYNNEYVYNVIFDKTILSIHIYVKNTNPPVYIGSAAFEFNKIIDWSRPWYLTKANIHITKDVKEFCNNQLKLKAFW